MNGKLFSALLHAYNIQVCLVKLLRFGALTCQIFTPSPQSVSKTESNHKLALTQTAAKKFTETDICITLSFVDSTRTQVHNILQFNKRKRRGNNTYQTKDSNKQNTCPQITATAASTNHNRHVSFAVDEGLTVL